MKRKRKALHSSGQEPAYNNHVALVALFVTIIALILEWVPFLNWTLFAIGFVLSLVALFRKPRSLAVWGLVLSIVDALLILTIISQ